ncbi:hypothetical protein CAC42_1920 [Sphaceloma murrayae]|uniref:Rhodopsin domain-containing protein n=1 Tax=Sphaceloma murrayae TaxID=2082308 RepID=A0A2K1QVU3_9PEZI|nr:hypothetical protein CAC42_1920 [Sphaceloma murrayae]
MANLQPHVGARGVMFLAVSYTLTFVGLIFVGLRAHGASRTKNGRWRWDFIWIILATAFLIPAVAISTVAVLSGMGSHVKTLTFPEVFKTAHYNYIALFVGQPALNFVKFSVIALLLSVQGPDAKKRKYFLWFLGALPMLGSIIQTILTFTSCVPMERLWKPIIPGECPRSAVSFDWNRWQGVQHGVIDITLALWPISIVWNLNTSKSVKFGFCVLMAVGIIPGLASFIRVTQLNQLKSTKDVTWDMPLFSVWTMVEAWLGIILSSIPPLRPLFLRVVYGIRGTNLGSSKTRPSGGISRMTGNHIQGIRTVEEGGEKSSVVDKGDVMINAISVSDSPKQDAELSNGGIMVSHAYTIEEDSKDH